MTKGIDIKYAITTAINNAKHPCDGHCENCPFDNIRFNMGFSWCKSMYKENLLKCINKAMIEVDEND